MLRSDDLHDDGLRDTRDEGRGEHHADDRDLCAPLSDSRLGTLQSRVVMSAMTRSAAPNHVATAAMAAYYARRAAGGVGLLLTESTAIAAIGDGFPDAPRIETAAQIDGWAIVTRAVHNAGASIFCQLLHCGRMSHADYTDGQQPVSATDRAADGINRRNGKHYATPRRLDATELPAVIRQFVDAAHSAVRAGFDGVELHLAHGYLPDQFLDAHVNDRDDHYGGTVANRCRFAIELTAAVVESIGATRVMARISPSRMMHGLHEWPDLRAMLATLVPALADVGLRMLDVSGARSEYAETAGRIVRMIRPDWPHLLIGGASLAREDAQRELDAGYLDLVTYARLLIANPDLVQRMRRGAPIDAFDPRMLDSLT